MIKESGGFRSRLKQAGLTDAAIDAAWPEWWSEAADASMSSSLDLRFSVARKLGLDARSLLDEDGELRFIWRDEARFKNLSAESEADLAAIASYGKALGNLISSVFKQSELHLSRTAAELRQSILVHRPFVGLEDLLILCWSCGVPVVHLRVYPLNRKRMAAMCVQVGNRPVILLAKDSSYPAQIAFYLAHELGHIMLGHLKGETAIVDLDDDEPRREEGDTEEAAADKFALELLTGNPEFRVMPEQGSTYNAPSLASEALRVKDTAQIEPGTLALCFGYSTGNWAVVNSAMRFIYGPPINVWQMVNRLALREIGDKHVPDDSVSFLYTVLGAGTL